MIIIGTFMPKWLIWIDLKFPFVHVRKGRRLS